MTKTFSALAAAFALAATLAIDLAPAQAWPLEESNGSQVSGLDLGSSRVSPFAGQTSGSGR